MVILTTKQVETLFGELEYIELQLEALDTHLEMLAKYISQSV
jgi:prefoldin subunit 5